MLSRRWGEREYEHESVACRSLARIQSMRAQQNHRCAAFGRWQGCLTWLVSDEIDIEERSRNTEQRNRIHVCARMQRVYTEADIYIHPYFGGTSIFGCV